MCISLTDTTRDRGPFCVGYSTGIQKSQAESGDPCHSRIETLHQAIHRKLTGGQTVFTFSPRKISHKSDDQVAVVVVDYISPQSRNSPGTLAVMSSSHVLLNISRLENDIKECMMKIWGHEPRAVQRDCIKDTLLMSCQSLPHYPCQPLLLVQPTSTGKSGVMRTAGVMMGGVGRPILTVGLIMKLTTRQEPTSRVDLA
jgi:hypothetical protein